MGQRFILRQITLAPIDYAVSSGRTPEPSLRRVPGSVGPGLPVFLLVLEHSCLPHLARNNLILLGLRAAPVHETCGCCRLHLLYFHSKFGLDLLDLLSYVLELVVLWL